MLPPEKPVKLPQIEMPTSWQEVIFRNYGYVWTRSLAKTLHCSPSKIELEARRLGLRKADPKIILRYQENGRITLIRNNWFLLPYSQLCTLIGMKEEELSSLFTLDPSLTERIGGYKPLCPEIRATRLSKEQIEATDDIRSSLGSSLLLGRDDAFRFYGADFRKETVGKKRTAAAGKRIAYGYSVPYLSPFDKSPSKFLPFSLLGEYLEAGVNGLWFNASLSDLAFSSLVEKEKANSKRRENLRKTVDRCTLYGIETYLKIDVRQEWANAGKDLERLSQELKSVLGVARIGGVFLVTSPLDCPDKEEKAEVLASEIANRLATISLEAKNPCEVIVSLQDWNAEHGFTEKRLLEALPLFHSSVSLLIPPALGLKVRRGGVSSHVDGDSLSCPGVGSVSEKLIQEAKESGHKVYAKLQAGVSWECPASPYLPVFDLLKEELDDLSEYGIEDFVVSFSLGGYPSPSLQLVSAYQKEGEDFSMEGWYKKQFLVYADLVEEAVAHFSKALSLWPYSPSSFAYSPKNLGEANLFSLAQEEVASAPYSFSFDDVSTWTMPYPPDVYLSQLKKLLLEWKKGLASLKKVERKPEKIEAMQRYATAAYCHFNAEYLQTEFSLWKADPKANERKLLHVLRESEKNVERLLRLISSDPKIGYDAQSQYLYTERNLLEKKLNCERLTKELDEDEDEEKEDRRDKEAG